MRVFAVWEPILPTDWSEPGAGTRARLSDRRVRQYWDQDHVLAKRLAADARDPQPKPTCCDMDGILWDLAVVYPPGASWDAKLPPARFFDGPVVRAKTGAEAMLVEVLGGK